MVNLSLFSDATLNIFSSIFKVRSFFLFSGSAELTERSCLYFESRFGKKDVILKYNSLSGLFSIKDCLSKIGKEGVVSRVDSFFVLFLSGAFLLKLYFSVNSFSPSSLTMLFKKFFASLFCSANRVISAITAPAIAVKPVNNSLVSLFLLIVFNFLFFLTVLQIMTGL